MSIKQRIADDMKQAMRDKDSVRLESLRMLRAAVQREEVDTQTELDDSQITSIVQKLVKQANDSIKQFTSGDRLDLADKEKASLDILMGYMPEQLSDDAVKALIDEAIESTGASEASDMGKVMGWLKPKIQGQADMGVVSAAVKAALS